MLTARPLAASALAVAVALTLGCRGSEVTPLDMGGPDGDQISALIEEVNEGIGNPKEVDLLFAKGAKTTDHKKLVRCCFSIVGKPNVTGTTGTAKVRVDSAAGGQCLGEVEWTFEKDGDKWKIKAAPLP